MTYKPSIKTKKLDFILTWRRKNNLNLIFFIGKMVIVPLPAFFTIIAQSPLMLHNYRNYCILPWENLYKEKMVITKKRKIEEYFHVWEWFLHEIGATIFGTQFVKLLFGVFSKFLKIVSSTLDFCCKVNNLL